MLFVAKTDLPITAHFYLSPHFFPLVYYISINHTYHQLDPAEDECGVEAIHVSVWDETSDDGEEEGGAEEVGGGGGWTRVIELYYVHEVQNYARHVGHKPYVVHEHHGCDSSKHVSH